MRAMVVYESMFGCTRSVAEAVAAGVERIMEVRLVEVGKAPPDLAGVDLLVVGAPTHAFGLSRPDSREQAAGRTLDPLVSPGEGVREWLAHADLGGIAAAASFSTVMGRPWMLRHLPSAGGAITRRMRRSGLEVLVAQEEFLVDGVTGPVGDGELDRATAWGEHVARLHRKRGAWSAAGGRPGVPRT